MALTQVAVCHTALHDSREAGTHLSKSVSEQLGGVQPDVIIVFASPSYSFPELIAALHEHAHPRILVGCSSAGEFSGCLSANSSASVMAIRSDDILFNAGVGTGLRHNREASAEQLYPVFTADQHKDHPYRFALVLTDALAGYADDLIHSITLHTKGSYQLFGGGAADDAKFHETHVFLGREQYADSAVVLEMLSKKPIGLGLKHGWEPLGAPLRVTEAEGNRLISMNATSAADIFEEHATLTGQIFNRGDPLPFFLHNVIGIDTGDGYKLRVPLALEADGSISCASEIPVGSTVYIMSGNTDTACDAARHAAQTAIEKLQGAKHAGSLMFDCAATRLRLGRAFGNELSAVATVLGSENFAGCNTYGQIVRAEGQFSGFHNCTAVVLAIPE